MHLIFGRIKSVEDLENDLKIKSFNAKIIDNRQKFKILVIDDKAFTALENLRRNKYDIVHVPDVSTIDSVSGYHIVLCDLIGVGVSLSPTMQGAIIISETKKNYPQKIVIAYTGGGNSQLVERSITIADYYLKKDASVEDWCEILDKAIADLANPCVVWRKIRHRLLDIGVTPYQLATLEDCFVRNFVSGREVFEPALLETAKRLSVVADARSVIQSFIGSVLFELVKG